MIDIKAVIFDMDGVLVDSELVINAAAIAGLKEFGVQASPEDFIPFVGAGEDRYIGGVAELHGVPFRLEMKKRVYELYVDMVAENIGIYKPALPTLKKLKDLGYIMAVASSADSVKVNANLKTAGIDTALFKTVISGEDVVHKKPHPDIYLLAGERLSLPPEQCIVVEDALNGIMAANNAGMKAIGLLTSFTRQEIEAAGADYICADIGGIVDILTNIREGSI